MQARNATLASQTNPMYWPERDFSVYMVNGQWFYCRLDETGPFAGWHRGSPAFVRDVEQAWLNGEVKWGK